MTPRRLCLPLALFATWILGLTPSAGLAQEDSTGEAAADSVQGVAEHLRSRFVVCPVETDLERRLLGDPGNPLADASLCVFVNGRAFGEENAIDAKSRSMLLLAAMLKRYAEQSNQLAVFRVLETVDGAEPFDQKQARAERISHLCNELADAAGYERVILSTVYNADDLGWDARITQAEELAKEDQPGGESSADDERVQLSRVATLLERLLVNADCVVDILPVLRQSEGSEFPDSFVADINALLPGVEFRERRGMLVRVRYAQSARSRLDQWVNDTDGRTAFAQRFGFQSCNLQQAMAAEDESQVDDAVMPTDEPAPHEAGGVFELTVLGHDGNPVPEITVSVRCNPAPDAKAISRGSFVQLRQRTSTVKTDGEGRLAVKLPEVFTIEITQPGFGPYWAQWNSGAPSSFTAELDEGWAVGGIVVDEQGAPVAGAIVHPSIEFKKRPGDGSQIGVGDEATTDANGAWHFDSVPASLSEVFVSIDHPQYGPLRRALPRGDFGLAEGEVPAAKLTLTRGLAIVGKVTAPDGKPIVGAKVRTKFVNDIREATTDAEGRYTLAGCELGRVRVVASAQGFALDLQEVDVAAEMPPVDFRMQTGGTIRVRVVDAAGKPVPDTRIFFQRWRGPVDYFEFDGVPDRTNEQGVWVWNEAPHDAIQADICPPGGIQLPYQPLEARDEEYVFTARPKLAIVGAVIDADSGEPVKELTATLGIMDQPDHISWARRDAHLSHNGRYRVEANRAYRSQIVRIEAAGYRAAVSREVASDEGEVTIDFKLERAKSLQSTVVTPSGAPAAGAKLAIGIPGAQINISNGDIDDTSTYAERVVADDSGRFQFPAQDQAFHLIITHPSGFAFFNSAKDRLPERTTLTPWARVEGTFRVGVDSQSGVTLNLNTGSPIQTFGGGGPHIFVDDEATTAARGEFTFNRVFPGRARVGRQIIRIVDEGATEATSSKMQPIELVAGETAHVDLGGQGRPIVGRLLPREGFRGDTRWRMASIDVSPRQSEPPAFDADDPLAEGNRRAWAAAEDARIGALPWFTASVDRDGTFRIDDVPAGTFTLVVRFHEIQGAGKLQQELVVPPMEGERSDTPLDLGDLQLGP